MNAELTAGSQQVDCVFVPQPEQTCLFCPEEIGVDDEVVRDPLISQYISKTHVMQCHPECWPVVPFSTYFRRVEFIWECQQCLKRFDVPYSLWSPSATTEEDREKDRESNRSFFESIAVHIYDHDVRNGN